jgi:hypothetical protein
MTVGGSASGGAPLNEARLHRASVFRQARATFRELDLHGPLTTRRPRRNKEKDGERVGVRGAETCLRSGCRRTGCWQWGCPGPRGRTRCPARERANVGTPRPGFRFLRRACPGRPPSGCIGRDPDLARSSVGSGEIDRHLAGAERRADFWNDLCRSRLPPGPSLRPGRCWPADGPLHQDPPNAGPTVSRPNLAPPSPSTAGSLSPPPVGSTDPAAPG